MTPAITMLPSFLRDLERYRAAATSEGIILRNGHVARGYNLNHHDRQKLVDAVCSLAEAIQAWAKIEPTQEERVVVAPTPDGPYGPIHQPPADIVMGAAAEPPKKPSEAPKARKASKPDILLANGVNVEVKAKRTYTKRKSDG